MENAENIEEYVTLWAEALMRCHYAGEVFLSQDQLKKIAKQKGLRYLDFERQNIAFTVIAVNCAYHYYDDQGFWIHFTDLLGCENNQGNRDSLGRRIEYTLRAFNLLKYQRVGPFRYVGSILEQCGVSRKYILTLGHMIKELKDHIGWEGLLVLTKSQFRYRVENFNCSKYLKNYLLDNAGWGFIERICQVTVLYEDGLMTIGDLKDLPGYQPDFWEIYLECFRNIKEKRNQQYIAKPRLIFLKEERCFGLLVSAPEILTGMKYPNNQQGWHYPLTKLNSIDLMVEVYEGFLETAEGIYKWKIPGWIPKGKSFLVNMNGMLLEHNTEVIPGQYYLLTPQKCDPQIQIIEELGSLAPIEWGYLVYLVDIKSTDKLPGYMVLEDDVDEIDIYWIEPERYMFTLPNPYLPLIFIESIPEIGVSNFSLIEDNRVALFCDIGNGPIRIRSREDVRELREISQTRAPIKGCLWLKVIGRNYRGNLHLGRLDFYLLPKDAIRYDNHLYSYDENIIINTKVYSALQISISGLPSTDQNKGEHIIPPNLDQIDIDIRTKAFFVRFHIPFFKARLFGHGLKPVRYMELNEVINSPEYLLNGYPKAEGKVYFSNYPDSFIPVKFDYNGHAKLAPEEIISLISKDNPAVSEVIIESEGYKCKTGAVIIDVDKIKDTVNEIKGIGQMASSVDNLGKMINLCKAIYTNPLANITITNLGKFTEGLDEWIYSILACAVVFDKTNVAIGESRFKWNEYIRDTDLSAILSNVENNNNGPEDWAYINMDHIPKVDRWITSVNSFTFLQTVGGRHKALKEWSEEINNNNSRFSSRLADLNGGSILSKAWKYYLIGKPGNSIKCINNIQNERGIIGELALILRAILYLRSAHFTATNKIIPEDIDEYNLNPILYLIKNITLIITKENKISGISSNDLNVVELLPLRHEDQNLFLQMLKLDSDPMKVSDSILESDDWLLVLVGTNIFGTEEKRLQLVSKAWEMRNSIPASPDKDKIIRNLRQNLGRN